LLVDLIDRGGRGVGARRRRRETGDETENEEKRQFAQAAKSPVGPAPKEAAE
jgi:hypothetical protein